MSGVLKLRISGVRAFDNYDYQELEFLRPLTLISGANGVGKTTVIECLRYATTGDLPPNAKGGAFVHDVRMSGVASVRAQVMLLYAGADGRRLVVTRSMQLSARGKAAATFKSLDGHLKIYGETESGSVSARCADLNRQVPLTLGVPPAVLNFVIFCHQEDSLWPLAEAAVVKKRFDEIFEATRYTKALESLKTVRKDYLSGIRVTQVQVQHLAADRERVREKRTLAAELARRVAALATARAEMQATRRLKSAELDALVSHGERRQGLRFAHKDAAGVCARLMDAIEDLAAEATVVDASEAELRSQLARTDELRAEMEAKVGELKVQRAAREAEIAEVSAHLSSLATRRGRAEQAGEQRAASARQLALLTLDAPGWAESARAQLETLAADAEEREIAHRESEQALAKKLSEAEAQQLSLRRSIAEHRRTRADLEARLGTARAAVAALDAPDDAWITQRVSEAQAELEVQTEALRSLQSEDPLGHAVVEVEELERAARQIRATLQETIAASGAQARRQYLQDDLAGARAKAFSLSREVSQLLSPPIILSQEGDTCEAKATAGSIDRDSSANNAVENEDAKVDRVLAAANAQITAVEKAAAERATLRDTLRAQLEQIRAQNATTESTHEDLLKYRRTLAAKVPANFEADLRKAENNVLEATEQLEQLQFAHSFFTKALDAATKESKCVLCDHHKSEPERVKFAAKLRARLAALSISPDQAENELNAAKSELARLRDLSDAHTKLRAADVEIERLSASLADGQENADIISAEIASSETRKIDVSALKTLATKLTRLVETRGEAARRLRLEASLASQRMLMTPQAAQQELETVESQLSSARSRADAARAKVDGLRERVVALEQTLRQLQIQLSDAERVRVELAHAHERCDELAESLATCVAALAAAEAKLEPAGTEVKSAHARLTEQKHAAALAERALAERRQELVADLKRYDDLTAEIALLDVTWGSDPIVSIAAEAESLKSQSSQLDAEVATLAERIAQHEHEIFDFDKFKRNLNDNLRLLSLRSELERAKTERDRCAEELARVETEAVDYEPRLERLQTEVGELNTAIATQTGEARALEEQAQQVEHELSSTYKDTNDLYTEAVARLSTTQRTTEDLAKCVKALDAAIMEYHTAKMTEINALLDELWRNTYTGTDIDTIMIRSESDAGSTSVRASYNYRVCMVKRDTELDMRGRCSAGQKVLACILIRMALAECFGNNCGLLVLDEPTTNLDHDNIDSLARSLDEVISARLQQKNFQLIVITHDERFLRQMNPSKYCSFYYRIERDERELSKIRKVPISALNA